MNKTVLLLTYYYHPCRYVAANRPNSFAKELVAHGFNVIVVTRHWKGNEQVWSDCLGDNDNEILIEKQGHLTIHRLPYRQTKYSKYSLISKQKTLMKLVAGQINADVNYYQYKSYIDELLSREKVDIILVSIPPLNALKLAAELSRKHNINFFVDVRDFENKIVLNKKLKVGFVDRVKHQLALIHSIRWFKSAALIFTITPPMTSFLRMRTKKNVLTIMNGFQQRLLDISEKEKDSFHITLTGSLYEIPELAELLEGFRVLFTKEFAKQITIQFIGTSTTERIVNLIKEVIPESNLILRERLPQDVAQAEAAKSQLLLVLGFKNMQGVLGTKAFEYMGLRKTIVQMPGDNDILEQMIVESNAGYCPHTPGEFAEIIGKCFQVWKENGYMNYSGNIEMIKKYSREEQFKELLPYLQSI